MARITVLLFSVFVMFPIAIRVMMKPEILKTNKQIFCYFSAWFCLLFLMFGCTVGWFK